MKKVKFDDVCTNPEVPQYLNEMYNNKNCSDTVFFVNQTQFYASSHVVSVSCKVLESMLDEHFENCGDREVKIRPIKYDSTFAVILKFIYGLEIKFSQLGIEVLCEALSLSEEYKLQNLVQQLKAYISKFDSFQLDNIVSLMNIAKKLNRRKLYEKSKLFFYQNADSCGKHCTFVDLRIDIVLDLIKSDFFCMNEIDILKSVLIWHDWNFVNSSTIDLFENNDEEMVTEFEDQEEQSNENNLSMEVAGSSDSNPSASNMAAEISTPSEENKNEDNFKLFSENIMIKLLSEVRFQQISVLEMNMFSNTALFKKYEDFFVDFKHASTISKPRKSYIPPSPIYTKIRDITRKFTIYSPFINRMYESVEEEIIGDIKWKLCMTVSNSGNHYQCEKLIMYLKCSSDVLQDWEFTANCQLKLLSGDENTGIRIFSPKNGISTPVTMRSNDSLVHFGDFYIHLSSSTIDSHFEIHVKSIQFKK